MINYIIGKSEGEDELEIKKILECVISNIIIRLMDKNEDNKFNTPFSICKLDIQ